MARLPHVTPNIVIDRFSLGRWDRLNQSKAWGHEGM